MTVGEKIRTLRIQHGMTMDELAEKIGVQRSAINKYEKGIVVNLKRSTIVSLCKVFNVPSSYFLEDDEVDTGLSADERRLLTAYRAADNRAREDALKTLLDHPRKKDELSAI